MATKSRWDDLPREHLTERVDRRFLYGERAMIAQIWIRKGGVVVQHRHEAEQLSYVVSGTLRLWLGEDKSEVHDVRAGEVLVIPSSVPHMAEALEDVYDIDVFSPRREDWIQGTDAYIRRGS